MLEIYGICSFNFFDVFTDSASVQQRFAGINTGTAQVSNLLYALSDLGGYAYKVTGHWQAQFHALVLKDKDRSTYYGRDG